MGKEEEEERKQLNFPLVKELILDADTPISTFLKFRGTDFFPIYLLESVEGGEKWGRYSALGLSPTSLTLKFWNGRTILNNRAEDKDPLSVLKEVLAKLKQGEGLPRLSLGLTGYISYDIYKLVESCVKTPLVDELGIPDINLVLCKNVIVFDNLRKTAKIISSSEEELEEIEKILLKRRVSSEFEIPSSSEFSSNMLRERFLEIVKEGKRRIFRGDVIQVVLSQRFSVRTDSDPFSVYRMLRVINPSPYMYYLDFSDTKIVGTSPEMLARYEEGVVETRPIAGTRPRGLTPEEDRTLEEELLKDPKELAEHTMLVDLARNDLGRVCEIGTVSVPKFAYVEKYSNVMHIVSDVRGKSERNPVEIFKACFPAGTVVGAPKVESAMIISELEETKRGPYAGAIGYFSLQGNMDMAILIRTIIFKDGKAYIQTGAGIVADSIPEREYDETMHKAMGMLRALGLK